MDRLKKLLNQPSVRVVLVYIVFSAIWVAYTDRIVEQIFTDPSTVTKAQTIKGWVFVLASGGVLLWVIKIAGRQLEINRDQYKAMLGDANIGIARLEKMKVVSSNPAFRNIMGRDSRELTEHTLFEFIDEYGRDGFRKAVELLDKQNSIQQELKVSLTRNKRRWVQINISKHKDQEGEYHQVILQNINDRKTYQAYTDLLLKVMLTLEPTDNFKAGLRGILNNLCLELNWEYGVAFTPGPDGEYHKQVSWYRLDPLFDEFDSKVEIYRFKSGEGLTGLTAREKQSVWIENLETDPRIMYQSDAIDADLRSVVSVPVVVSEEVIAVLILFSREPLDSDEELLKLLTAIGHDIGIKLEKRKQQDEKEKLENSLNFALKSASMATWDMDLESGNVIRSQNHHELFGFDRAPETWNVDDLIGTILEEDRENVNKQLYEAVFETKGFNAEFRIKKNGSIRWLWSRGDLQYDTYGEPERLSGVVTDITKRKQFQIYTELLLEIFLSIEPLKDLQIAYGDILKVICKKNIWQYGEIWQFNKESGTSECTNTWSHPDDELLKTFGNYSKGKILEEGVGIPGSGKNSNELLWISDIRQDKRLLRRKKAAAAGLVSAVSIPLGVDEKPVAFILLFTKYQLEQDEDTVNFLNAIRNNLGMKLARKKLQDQIESERQELLTIFNNMPVFINIHDKDSGIGEVNSFFEERLGYTQKDIRDINLLKLITTEQGYEEAQEHIKRADGSWKDFELIAKDGERLQSTWTNIRLSEARSIGIGLDISERKKMEDKIETERQRFELAVDAVSDVVWDFDALHDTLWWNEGIETVFGYDRQAVLGQKKFWENHIHAEDREKTIRSMREAENSDALKWSASYRFLDAGGGIREVEDTARIIRDEDGNLVRIIGAMLDVTELKNYQRELQEERTRFEAIATLTNDVIYDYDVASEHFWASEGIYSIMGYDPGKYPVAIEWWKEHLHPEDRERMIERLDNVLESDAEEWNVNYRFIGAGGAEKNIIENALIIRDEKNQPVRMLGAMIDVTAEKNAEHALRESEEQYRRLFDQNPYPMGIHDPKTSEILQVNQAMILKYGYTEKEFESIKILDLSPPEEAARLKKELQEKPDGLRIYQGVTHLKKDGSKLIVDVTALDIRYKGDQQRLVVINDITRQKRAEEKIIGSVIEGSEKERRRIAKELHDGLGQYLTAASMNLDSVYEELNSLPEVKWNQYEKGLKLLRNAIVESRRISQNLLPKAIEDFGLSLAVQSLVDDFSDSFDTEISHSDNLGDIKLSESVELNIYRIIQEATNNAARHSGCSRIDIQLILDDHRLICTIEDNGRGFDYSSKKDQGIGLTSIRNRVNALSGEMDISTGKGKGTLVSVIVPVKTV